jgi:uncharacterized membrane protein HdeD (DUF308 family)
VTTRSRDQTKSPSDVVLGTILAVGGVLLIAAAQLKVLPSLAALGAFALVAGIISLVGAFIGRSEAGFWTELVQGSLMLVFGVTVLRFQQIGTGTLVVFAGVVFIVIGLVRLASAVRFGSARRTSLFAGVFSLALGGASWSNALTPGLTIIGILIGAELLADGVAALVLGSTEQSARRPS